MLIFHYMFLFLFFQSVSNFRKKYYTFYYEKPLVKPIKDIKMYILAEKLTVLASFQGGTYDLIIGYSRVTHYL